MTCRHALLILLVFLVCPRPAIARQVSEIDERFLRYCTQADAMRDVCALPDIPLTHKYDVLNHYCSPAPATVLGAEHPCRDFGDVAPPLALRYDHRLGRWDMRLGGFEAHRRRVELDRVSLVPIAHLAPGDRLGIVVANTNPLLFVANRGEAREEATDQVKGLEAMLTALGPGLGTLVGSLAKDRDSLRNSITGLSIDLSNDAKAAVLRDSMSLASTTPTAAVLSAAADRRALANDLEWIRSRIEPIEAAIKSLQTDLTAFVGQRTALQVAAQQLESGPVILERALDTGFVNPARWPRLFSPVGTAVGAVLPTATCTATFEAFVAMLGVKLDDPVAAHTAASRVLQFSTAPPTSSSSRACAVLEYPARLEATARAVQTAALDASRTPADASLSAAMRAALANARGQHAEHVLALQRHLTDLGRVVDQAKEVLGKQEDTRKGSVSMGMLVARVLTSAVGMEGNRFRIANRLYLPDEQFRPGFFRTRITPIKLTLNSPTVEAVPTELPKESTTTYRLIRRGLDRFSFGVGMLAYAPVHNITYSVVDPDPSSNTTISTTTTTTPVSGTTETTKVDQPELKTIREKDRVTRAGAYAMFVNARGFGTSSFGVGAQGGVALSADNPAFLLGAAINLSDYATLGVGRGIFRVKQLAEDLAAEDVRVLNADDIRLEDRWPWQWYVSLSVNLNGLPLFK